ncbi:hypothetical protein AB0N60_37965 [Streptomyces microflavus]|uniref:hypothetical protein n=1 Tax=Streptomyces microflavus TaxID=1919 RepID=UPI00342426A5
MTEYVCTACPFQADGLDELHQHSLETGHVGISKTKAPSGGSKFFKLTKHLVASQGVALGALAACTYLYAKWQTAEAENAYLKAPSGAGRNLKSHDKSRDKE